MKKLLLICFLALSAFYGSSTFAVTIMLQDQTYKSIQASGGKYYCHRHLFALSDHDDSGNISRPQINPADEAQYSHGTYYDDTANQIFTTSGQCDTTPVTFFAGYVQNAGPQITSSNWWVTGYGKMVGFNYGEIAYVNQNLSISGGGLNPPYALDNYCICAEGQCARATKAGWHAEIHPTGSFIVVTIKNADLCPSSVSK